MRRSTSRATRSIRAVSAAADGLRTALSRNASVAAETECAAVAAVWVSVVMAVLLISWGIRRCSAEESVDDRRGLLKLFDLRDVSALVDDGHLAAGDQGGEVVGVADRNEPVVATPDDQRARGDAVQPPPQAPVGDRPRELAGAAQRPDQPGRGRDR